MDAQFIQLLALGLSLTGYCLFHSWMASLSCKRRVARRWPALVPGYRLLFNLLALLLLIPSGWLLLSYPGDLLWQWSGYGRWLADGLALMAVLCFVHSLRSYDMGLFLGLRQWREDAAEADGREGFRVSFWHRFVRHPWYFFALIVLWTREMNAAQLLAYGLISLYLVVGSRLEEERLIALYGDSYRRYRQRVAGLLPLPWRRLSADDARSLERQARESLSDQRC